VDNITQWVTWWFWYRWRIYCPKYSVTHLFDQGKSFVNTPLGIMEFPSQDSFKNSLFHWDEAFVSPCTLNEIWCGSSIGKWTPKIQFLGFEMDD